MKRIRGHFDGRTVVLDEPAPVQRRVDVLVEFPDEFSVDTNGRTLDWYWEQSRAILQDPEGSTSEELRRQRDAE